MEKNRMGMCITALVMGVLGLMICSVPYISIICSVLGVVFGAVGLSSSRGRGFARAGFITGICGIIAALIITVVYVSKFMEFFEPNPNGPGFFFHYDSREKGKDRDDEDEDEDGDGGVSPDEGFGNYYWDDYFGDYFDDYFDFYDDRDDYHDHYDKHHYEHHDGLI